MKRIEDQWKKQIKTLKEHGKQLDKYSDEKESLTYSKQKFFFEELANRRMEEIKYLSKQIDFNNLTYRHKGNIPLVSFIGPLGFYKNIQQG